MSATLKVFHVGEKCFTHFMNTRDDSIELRDEGGEVLLTYDFDAKVSNREGRMGRFYFEQLDGQPRWVYYEMPQQTRIVMGPDLFTAEVEVSRRYLGRLGGAAPLPAMA